MICKDCDTYFTKAYSDNWFALSENSVKNLKNLGARNLEKYILEKGILVM